LPAKFKRPAPTLVIFPGPVMTLFKLNVTAALLTLKIASLVTAMGPMMVFAPPEVALTFVLKPSPPIVKTLLI
jgi:hypothetical protein